MDRWEAQYQFWSGFGVPAYEQNSVPDADDVTFPYITYQAASSGFGGVSYLSASIWTKSTSWLTADHISDLIEDTLKDGGVFFPYDGGAVWFTLGDPFSESMGDPSDDTVKRKLLSVIVQFV